MTAKRIEELSVGCAAVLRRRDLSALFAELLDDLGFLAYAEIRRAMKLRCSWY